MQVFNPGMTFKPLEDSFPPFFFTHPFMKYIRLCKKGTKMKKFAIIVVVIIAMFGIFTFAGGKLAKALNKDSVATGEETVLELNEDGYDIVITKTDHDKYPYIVEMTTKIEGYGRNVITGGPVNYGYMRIEMSVDEETYQDMTNPNYMRN